MSLGRKIQRTVHDRRDTVQNSSQKIKKENLYAAQPLELASRTLVETRFDVVKILR